MAKKIIVCMSGGCIQDVIFPDGVPADLVVRVEDTDTEGADSDTLGVSELDGSVVWVGEWTPSGP